MYVVVFERARAAKGQGRPEAHETARRIIGNERIPRGQYHGQYEGTPTGQRMHEVISALYNEGLYDPRDNEGREIYYEEDEPS
jgi:hypothetical protein